jgi:hypothetical protein
MNGVRSVSPKPRPPCQRTNELYDKILRRAMLTARADSLIRKGTPLQLAERPQSALIQFALIQ